MNDLKIVPGVGTAATSVEERTDAPDPIQPAPGTRVTLSIEQESRLRGRLDALISYADDLGLTVSIDVFDLADESAFGLLPGGVDTEVGTRVREQRYSNGKHRVWLFLGPKAAA